MSVRIQLRRDTAANWTSTNPTLTQGEPGYETDTGKIKYGDGTTAWNSLDYAPAAAVVDGTIVNADVNASAAIAGTKISPNFGSQNVDTTGTSTAASFTPTSSTVPTNGVYLSAENTLALASNSTSRLTIDANGNINADSGTFYVDAVNNRVGIGTVSSDKLLTVNGDIQFANKLVLNDTNTASQNGVTAANAVVTTTSTSSTQYYAPSAIYTSSSISSPAWNATSISLRPTNYAGDLVIAAGDAVTTHNANAWSHSVAGNVVIRAGAAYNSTAGANNTRHTYVRGKISFQTATASTQSDSTYAERFVITDAGLVGIGVTSPSNSLVVAGNLINGLQGTGTINVVSNTTTNNGADATPSIGFSAPYDTGGTRILYGAIQARKSNSNAGNTSGYLSFLTSPTSSTGVIERLTISGTGTTTLTSAASTAPFIANIGASEVARIDSAGRLLVGTTSARDVAEAANSTRVGGINVEASGDVVNVFTGIINRNDTNGAIIALAHSRGTTGGSNTILQSNDRFGTIVFAGADGTDLNSVGAKIEAFVDGTPGANDMPGRLVIATTADGTSTPTERMRISSGGTTTLTSAASTAPFIANIGASEVARIDSAGRLLVGTSSGSALLHVNGTFRAGDYGISAGVLGNNATMLASTPPSGAVAAEIMCYGKDYNTLDSNTHAGFLLAHWSADTNTITTITSTNHSAGTNQGFEAIWSGTQIVVRNKAGMSVNQRGRAFVRYLA